MDSKHITTFLTVAQTNNFSKAAEILNCAQSTVSVHIDKLEDELNLSLFYRKKHGIILTGEGKRFIKYAERFANIEKEYKNELHSSSVNKEIIIALQESQLLYRYQQRIFDWIQNNPDINVIFKTAHSSFSLKDQLTSGEIDIAVLSDNNLYNPSLNRILLTKDPLVLVSNKRISISHIKDLNEYRILMTEKGCSYREELENFLRVNETNRINKIEMISIEALKNYLYEHPSIALLPKFLVENDLNKNLYEVQLEYSWPDLHTHLLFSRNNEDPKIQELIRIFQSVATIN